MDVLDEIAAEIGKSIAQVSLNCLLQRPTVDNIISGAGNEEQLKTKPGYGWLEPYYRPGTKAERSE